ncbi:hypothetical protein [Salinithrix halophila]
MQEWQPQMIIGLFIGLGLLLSILGAIFIEKTISRLWKKPAQPETVEDQGQ